MKTLLIEDNPTVRLITEKQLRFLGHDVTACVDAETALEIYRQTFYPLIVVDLELPGMNGIEYTQRIRALPQGSRSMVLIVTGHDRPEHLAAALQAGVDDYATKPLDTEQLRVRLNIIEQRRENLYQRYQTREELHLFKAMIESSHEAIEISDSAGKEEALRVSAHQYRLLAENVADGIGIAQNNQFVFVNEALATMLGSERDLLLGKSPEEFFQGEYREFLLKTPEQALEDLATPRWQMLEIATSGESRALWVEGHHCSISWQGKPAILLTLRDLTDHKRHELEMTAERTQLQQEISRLRSTLKERYRFGDIIGRSPAMQAVYEMILKAANTEASVVICGESGTGKNLVAQTIHQLSSRQNGAFVPVSCGSIPESLMENEFFGYREGACTEADKSGFFDAAHQGTLFLDEIGELSLAMQVKILQAIEGKGDTLTGKHSLKQSDIRIIAATHKNLRMLQQQGDMRKDFFYHIHVVTITVPPLRERKEDIPLLVDHFLEQFGSALRFHDLPKNIAGSLLIYDWPGNIQELQNALHQYLTLQRFDFLDTHTAGMSGEELADTCEGTDNLPFRQAVEQFEKRLIQRALERNHWHRTRTAEALGLPRKTLFRKIKLYKLL